MERKRNSKEEVMNQTNGQRTSGRRADVCCSKTTPTPDQQGGVSSTVRVRKAEL